MEPEDPAGGETDVLDLLLERALRGDEEALGALLALLGTRHYRRVINSLRRLRSDAHTATLEDVFQDSVVKLVERIRSGELSELSPAERPGLLKYFQTLCDGRLRDTLKPRKSPVLARRKEPLPPDLPDKRVPEGPKTEHLRLLESALRRLEPAEEELLRKYLAGVPYKEIARQTGKSENALMKAVSNAKRKILADILPKSQTARLNIDKTRGRGKKPPGAEEILRAVRALPPELKEAIQFVHFEGGTPERLAARLGDRGLEKVRARLTQGYRRLAGTLGVPFPDSFSELER
jgi:RNA polymerase sigma factor (sigma-70 family)